MPVVPEDAWMRTSCFFGTENIPKGYVSRRSAFVVNGMYSISASVFILSAVTPAADRRLW